MWGFVADSAYNGGHSCPCEREIKLTPAEAKETLEWLRRLVWPGSKQLCTALEVAISALNKQIPYQCAVTSNGQRICYRCGAQLDKYQPHCKECGAAIDWTIARKLEAKAKREAKRAAKKAEEAKKEAEKQNDTRA